MTDDTNHSAEDEPSAENSTPASRRTFMKVAGASAGTYALGTSAATAQDVPTLTVDLADNEIDPGETTTATFTAENVPEGSSGATIEISVDSDVAAIVEIQDTSFDSIYNDEIEEDYDGAAPSLSIGTAGGIASGDVVGTYVIEGQGDGSTALELTDFSLTDADSNVIEEASYDAPTLTVGDDGGSSGGVSAPQNLEVVSASETSVELDWSADDNAVEYNVYVDSVLETTTSSTGATITGLEANQTYEIDVTAVGADGEESDAATVVASTDDDQPAEVPRLTVDLADDQIEAGETTTVDLGLDTAPEGLYGFAFELQFDGNVVTATDAEVSDTFPDESELLTSVEISDNYVDLRSQQEIEPTASAIEFGQVTLEGDADGETDLEVDVGLITDVDDEEFTPETESATLTVGDNGGTGGEPTLTVDLADDQIEAGQTTTVDLGLDEAPNGLYGFAFELQFDGNVATATDAEVSDMFPDESELLTSVEIGDDYVDLRSQQEIEPGASIDFGQVTLEGDSAGETDLEIDVGLITDVDDEEFTPETESATLTVGDNGGTGGEPTLTVDLADDQIEAGQTTTVDLGLDPASEGLYGFAFELQFDGDVVTATDAEISDTFPDESELLTSVEIGDDYVDLRSQEEIEPTDSSIDFGQVTLEGDADGETDLEVDVGLITDVDDEEFTPETESATLTVGDNGGTGGEPTLTVDLADDQIETGQTTTVDLGLDPASEGLYGFAFELQFDGNVVTATDAEISDTFPDESELLTSVEIGDDYVDLRSQEEIEPTDSSIEFGQVTLEGEAGGETALEVDVGLITDVDDNEFTPETESATLVVEGDGTQYPSTPENLSADAGTNSIDVSWSGDANAAEYNVYLDGSLETTTSATSTTITGLEANTAYEIGVSAVAEDGTETDTATVTATTEEGSNGGGDYEQWDPDTLYQRGERVSWNGENWEAKWTNQGQEPEYDVRGAWEPLDGEIPLQQDLVDIEASPTSAGTGDRIELRAIDTSADTAWIEGLEWDLGDGTTGSGWFIAHSYDSSGTYTVTLTATDQRGRQSTAQVQITVS